MVKSTKDRLSGELAKALDGPIARRILGQGQIPPSAPERSRPSPARPSGTARSVVVGAVAAAYSFELAIAMLAALYALDILAMLVLIPECRGAELA